MYQLYNTQSSITTSLRDFFEISCNLRKTQLNILPAIIFGMAISESCITNDIVKNLIISHSKVFFNYFLSVEPNPEVLIPSEQSSSVNKYFWNIAWPITSPFLIINSLSVTL